MTVVPQGPLGYLTAWPTGQTQPVVSTLNSLDGTVLANAAIVPAGTGGAVSFFASDTTDLVVDINGYFASPGATRAQLLYGDPVPAGGYTQPGRSSWRSDCRRRNDEDFSPAGWFLRITGYSGGRRLTR